jgi:hypothetical protein
MAQGSSLSGIVITIPDLPTSIPALQACYARLRTGAPTKYVTEYRNFHDVRRPALLYSSSIASTSTNKPQQTRRHSGAARMKGAYRCLCSP